MSIREDAKTAASKKHDDLNIVKLAIIGKGGAGKSALINAIVDEYICETGVKTDTTLEASIGIHYGDMVFTDLPGFGTKGFPKEQWESKFKPEQYDLLIHVINSKLTKDDSDFCKKVTESGLSVVVVRTFDDLLKGSKVHQRQEICNDIITAYGKSVPVSFIGHGNDESDSYGVDDCIFQIENNLSEAKKASFSRWAKVFTLDQLEKKTSAAYSMVHEKAMLSALASSVPVVGLGADFKVQYDLSKEIKNIFGINEEQYEDILAKHGEVIKPLLDEVLSFGTKEGIALLVKQLAGRKAATELFNKIPLLGNFIAAGIGFGLTELMGHYMVTQASELANLILKNELEIS